MSWGPAGAAAELDDAPGLDLLLEQPAQAAAAMARPATPTTISRFTYCTPSCRWCRYLRSLSTSADPTRPTKVPCSGHRDGGYPQPLSAKPPLRRDARCTSRQEP